MDDQWTLCTTRNAITHNSTGFHIKFEGKPNSTFFNGTPSSFPRGLTNIEIARLIREGFDFYRRQYSREKPLILVLKSR